MEVEENQGGKTSAPVGRRIFLPKIKEDST